MMILPLADALQNCLQNLTSRIAGIDNEQMTGRVMGMGAMLGYGIGAIKEQFKTTSLNTTTGGTLANNSNNDNSVNGLKGFVSRAKAVINPTMNLSDEKDYNGNVNPIRNVIQTTPKTNNNTNQVQTTRSNIENKQSNIYENKITPKSIVKGVAKTGLNATKTYLDIGARMVEGDFNKFSYNYKKTKANNNNNNINRRKNLQNTEYADNINQLKIKETGDNNEHKK